jgi:hypothetical protein
LTALRNRNEVFGRRKGGFMGTSASGIDDGAGFGVRGTSNSPHIGKGVEGISTGGDGVLGQTRGVHAAGVRGIHTGHISAIAVIGELQQGTTAVKGEQGGRSGVGGDEVIGSGVWGDSTKGVGVVGTSSTSDGVLGEGPTFGVHGISANGIGVCGESTNFEGVRGISHSQHGGIVGINDNGGTSAGEGVYGESTNGEGVRGISHSPSHGGVVGTNEDSNGIGIYGKGGRLAALFDGDVEVSGEIKFIGADCAEEFAIATNTGIDPGTVMTIDSDGTLSPSAVAYDRCVAGVVSGAGDCKPGIVLGKQPREQQRATLALIGKVFCKVDAEYAPIRTGDLLTTSDTPGHAMRAVDPQRAFGTVIGKALRSLRNGRGLIPILVTMQ